MGASFFSKSSKQFRGLITLGFLLITLLGTHWIGFSHGISHSGLKHQITELSCTEHGPAIEHSSASCHLFDALTLAGFAPLEPSVIFFPNEYSLELFSRIDSNSSLAFQALYQSRAPPRLIL